jgi:hypothetical protein
VLEFVPTVNWVSGVVPPVTPLNVTSPSVPGFNVKLFAPFMVDEKVILSPAVLLLATRLSIFT